MSRQQIYNTGNNIREMLSFCVDKVPDNAAFKIKKEGEIQTITFKKLSRDVKCLGTYLLEGGFVQKKIGIIGENSYPWYCAFLATVNSGNISVPFDKGFTAEELANCIKRSEISALFYDDKHIDVVKAAVEECKGQAINTYLMHGEAQFFDEILKIGERMLLEGSGEFDKVEIVNDELAVLLFTSGTTSTSKAVMLSHHNFMSNAKDMQQFEDFYSNDVNMAFLPFHHSFGLGGVLVFMASGACSVFCDGLKYVQRNMAEYGVTVFVGVPLIVENLYKKVMTKARKDGLEKKIRSGLRLSKFLRVLGIDARRKIFSKVIAGLGGSLRLIIVGAAAVSPETAQGLNDFGIVTIQGYGLTETSPVLSAERPSDLCCGSVGKPLPSVEIKLDEKNDEGVGEIIAKAPNVMLGYYNQPEETAEVLKDGWFYTGDLGSFDKKGNLWIRGRKKNVIVMKNGKNIFPEEIESLIGNLSYVAENMLFTREKHNELVLWVKIVYKAEYLEQEGIDVEQLAERVSFDLQQINSEMPTFKAVNHFILTDQPMIKTTTQKVKRNLEMDFIEKNQESEKAYIVK